MILCRCDRHSNTQHVRGGIIRGEAKKNLERFKEDLAEAFPRAWRFALVLTGKRSDADDLAQAAMLRALEKRDQFQPGTHLDRWVMRITQNIWRNQQRATAVRRGQGIVDVDEFEIPDRTVDVEVNIFAGEVLSAVGRLPEAQRAAVLLVYVEGFSYAETAETLEIPVGTVMSRLAAARARLKKALT